MVLGVTGGIASGKSAVAEMLRELGAIVVSADELSREVVRPGSSVLRQLQQRFGDQIIALDGSLRRKKLGDYVFANAAARHDLEQIIHPAIAALSQQRLQEAAELQRADGGLVVYEAPLLFEVGARQRVDRVLAVTVDEEVQLRRLQQRDNCSVEAARQRVAAQMPQSEKARLADYVINNSAGVDELRREVEQLYHQLIDEVS